MAVIYLEGFDNLNLSSAALRVTGTVNAYGPNAGRRSGGAIGHSNNALFSVPASTNSTTALIGFAIKPALAVGYEFGFRSAAGKVVSFIISSSGAISAYRGAPTTNLLGTASGVFTTSSFQYLEAKVVSHASTGSVEIKSNGVTILNLTNVNTAGASGNFSDIYFQGYSGSTVSNWVDDIYVTDAADGFWGDTAVISYLPDSNGANTGWSGDGATAINELVPNGAAGISSSTANQKSTFNLSEYADAAYQQSVTATSGGNGGNLVDGSDTSYNGFNGSSTNQSGTVDLTASKAIKFYRIAQDSNSSYQSAFKVQSSTDNSTWTDHESYASTSVDTGYVAINVTARYWRVLSTGTTPFLGWRLFTMAFYTASDLSTAKSIKAVQMTLDMSTTTGSATIQPIVRISGTDYTLGSSAPVASGVAGPVKSIATVSPATSAAFTVSEFNAAEFGVRFEG